MIGGIWVAASAVQRNQKLADDTTGILQIHSAMRNTLSNLPPANETPLETLIATTVNLPASWKGLQTNFGALEVSYEVVSGTPGIKVTFRYANNNCIFALRHIFPKLASSVRYEHNGSAWTPITPEMLLSPEYIENVFCYDQINYGAAMSLHLAF